MDPVWPGGGDPDLSGLRGRLRRVRENGPASRPGHLRPHGERAAAPAAGGAPQAPAQGPGGLSGLRTALGRAQNRGPGSWGRYAAPAAAAPRTPPRVTGPGMNPRPQTPPAQPAPEALSDPGEPTGLRGAA